jgi:cell division protein FtsW (lipid II flippase)
MQSKKSVEIADRVSRKRAVGAAVAASVFLAIQVITRPFFVSGIETAQRAKIDLWAVNAIVLLLLLATGGGLMWRSQIRALVNDEVSRSNYKTAVNAGFWVAMASAMGLYLLPGFNTFTSREAVYVIVTASVCVALLVFSYLELRAHRDA